jgi:translation initiation factor eIF-2B subunit epsilon
MVHKIRNFIRNNDNIVLLVCDYYQTKQIPYEMTLKKDNLALFPVANIPMIDFILKSLINRSLTNIILCGEFIDKIIEHVSLFYTKKINWISWSGESSLGDVIRYFNDINYDLKDMLVMYANHYTNFDLNNLFETHRKNNNLVTFFLHENISNSKIKNFYGTKDNQIVFYERSVNDKFNQKHVQETVEKYKTVEFNFKGSSPNLAVISPKVFQMFTDNFDFNSLADFLESLLAFNPFNLKIGYLENEKILLPSLKSVYSREILTLYDYYRFNEDNIKYEIEDISQLTQNSDLLKSDNNYFFDLPEGFSIENTVLGYNNKLGDEYCIKDSSVGNRCIISGNVRRCIIWDDVNVTEDLEEIIVFSNGHKINVHYLEVEMEIEEVEEEKGNFFDDIVTYLNECDEILESDNNLESIIRQVNLIRIVWNASDLDFIEAFAIFLIEYINENDMESSTINASAYFPLLSGSINCIEDQEELLSIMYNLMIENDIEYRKQVLFRYGYLFIEDGIICKNVLKKYNKMIKKGTF